MYERHANLCCKCDLTSNVFVRVRVRMSGRYKKLWYEDRHILKREPSLQPTPRFDPHVHSSRFLFARNTCSIFLFFLTLKKMTKNSLPFQLKNCLTIFSDERHVYRVLCLLILHPKGTLLVTLLLTPAGLGFLKVEADLGVVAVHPVANHARTEPEEFRQPGT